MSTKNASEFFEIGAAGLPVVATPVNKSPSVGSVAGSQTPLLRSGGYVSLYNQPQMSARFVIYDATGSVIIQDSGDLLTVNDVPIEEWQVPTPLALATTFMWQHSFRSTKGEDYIDSAKTSFTMPSSSVGAPEITNIVDGEETELQIFVQGSAFQSIGTGQTHLATTIQIATDDSFTVDVEEFVHSTGDLTSALINLSQASTNYFIRMKYEGNLTGYSAYSDEFMVTTVSNSVKIPSIASPYHGEFDVQNNVKVISSAFQYGGLPQSHTGAEWEVYTDAGLTQLVYSTGLSTTSLNSINVPNLLESTSYFVRKRDEGSLTGLSDWSNVSQFTTAATFSDWKGWDATVDGLDFVTTSDLSELEDETKVGIVAGKTVVVTTFGNARVDFHQVDTYGLEISSLDIFSVVITANDMLDIVMLDESVLLVYRGVTINTIAIKTVTPNGNSFDVVDHGQVGSGDKLNSVISRVNGSKIVEISKPSATTNSQYSIIELVAGVPTVKTDNEPTGFANSNPTRIKVNSSGTYVASKHASDVFLHTLDLSTNLFTSTMQVAGSQVATTNGGMMWLAEDKLMFTKTSTTPVGLDLKLASYDGTTVTVDSVFYTAYTKTKSVLVNDSEFFLYGDSDIAHYRFVGDFIYATTPVSPAGAGVVVYLYVLDPIRMLAIKDPGTLGTWNIMNGEDQT